MDVNAAIQLFWEMVDDDDLDGAEQALRDVADWIGRGGFPPNDMTGQQVFTLMGWLQDAKQVQ